MRKRKKIIAKQEAENKPKPEPPEVGGTQSTRPEDEPPVLMLLSRKKHERREGAQQEIVPLGALAETLFRVLELPCEGSEPTSLSWDDKTLLSLVDVDIHHCKDPVDVEWLFSYTRAFPPSPSAIWTSHGGGVHALFMADSFADGEGNAHNKAWLWSLLLQLDNRLDVRIEIKTDTWHPRCNRLEIDGSLSQTSNYIWLGPQPAGKQELHSLLVDRLELGFCQNDEQLTRLHRDDWAPGKRYPHEKCPGRPNHASKSSPVVALEWGVYCHSCDGNGYKAFWPWNGFVAGVERKKHLFLEAAKQLVHWHHAKHIGAYTLPDLPEGARKNLYRHLVNHFTPTSSYVSNKVFNNDLRIVRGILDWFYDESFEVVDRRSMRKDYVQQLPAALSRSGPNSSVDSVRRGLLLSPKPNMCGYYPVEPVRNGSIFSAFHSPETSEKAIVIPVKERLCRPSYCTPERRFSPCEIDAIISNCFPGINMSYLRLLLVAYGIGESGIGRLPIIVAFGPSGAGKSATIKIAAALVGNGHVGAISSLKEQFIDLAGRNSENSCYLVIDEFAKLCRGRGGFDDSRIYPVLQLDRSITYHQLYRGQVNAFLRCPVVLTDLEVPFGLQGNRQFMRRVVLVELDRIVGDWSHSLANQPLCRWWDRDPKTFQAAESLLSEIVDTWFPQGAKRFPNMEQVCRHYGFSSGLDAWSENQEEVDIELLDLFFAVCNVEPDGKGGFREKKRSACGESRFNARGYKLINRSVSDDASRLWRNISANSDWFAPTATTERGDDFITALLGSSFPIYLHTRKKGGHLAIRFSDKPKRSGGRLPKGQRELINEELLLSDLQLSMNPPPSSGNGASLDSPSIPQLQAPQLEGESNNCGAINDAQISNIRKLLDLLGSLEREETSCLSGVAPAFVELETRSLASLRQVRLQNYVSESSTECISAVALHGKSLFAWCLGGDARFCAQIRKVLVEYGLSLVCDGFEPVLVFDVLSSHQLELTTAMLRAGKAPQQLGGAGRNELFSTRDLCALLGLPEQPEKAAFALWGLQLETFQDPHRLRVRRLQGQVSSIIDEGTAQLLATSCLERVLLGACFFAALRHKVPTQELRVMRASRAINNRGFQLDRCSSEAVLNGHEQYLQLRREKLLKATRGRVTPENLRKPCTFQYLAGLLQAKGVSFDLAQADEGNGLSEDEAAALLEMPEVREDLVLRTSLEYLVTGRLTSLKKLEAGLSLSDSNGLISHSLKYCGAHTGRWTGTGFQPHNIPKRKIPESLALDATIQQLASDPRGFVEGPDGRLWEGFARSSIRPMIIPRSGKCLAIYDYDKAELVTLLWLAGDEQKLRAAVEGDPYCDLASRIFGRSISKKDQLEREVGKAAVLGCGYGMGKARFAKMCKERGIDLELSSASAEQVIRGYRKEYASVTALWTELERGVLSVVSGDSLSFRYESALGASLEIARCELVKGIAVKLPSGRELLFHNTSIRPGKYTKKSAFCRKPGGSGQGHELYGGLLTENIVQAIARDLLADALVRLQNITIPLSSGEIATAQIVLHVHDEIIWELALNSDDDALWKEAGQSLVQQMIELPPWASGLTLSASGFIASRYFSEPPDEMLTLSATSCSQTR